MAEYDLPYDYFDEKYVPVCDVVSNRSTEEGENTKSLEETIMELSDHTTVTSDTRSSASHSGSGSAPSPQASFVSGSTTSTQNGSAKKCLPPKKPPLPRPGPMERYDVRVNFPKQPQTGEIMRVNPGRKVRTLVDYLMSIIRRTEAQDTREGRNIRTSMSEQVKIAIMQAATGHLSAENFIRVISNYVRVDNDRYFITFLKASFPRLSRRFLKGEVAIEPFVPLQTLYAKDFFTIPFDGHFLWGVYREYYEKLVQNGEAPPISEQAAAAQEYDLFDSDSESTIAAKSAADSEENSLVEQEPCRVFTGAMLDDTFINTDVLAARFKAILGDDVEIEDEALLLISEAAQDRVQRVIDRVVDLAEHRAMADWEYLPPELDAPPDDTARQGQILEEVDRCAAEKKEARDKMDTTEGSKKKTKKSKTAKEKRRKTAEQKKVHKSKSKKLKKKASAAATAATTPGAAVAAASPDTPLATNDGCPIIQDDGPPTIRALLRDLQMACKLLDIRSTVGYKIAIGPNRYPTASASGNGPASN
ncbi:hypothetical protein Aduo_019619 [Ancylostoma duodenale]